MNNETSRICPDAVVAIFRTVWHLAGGKSRKISARAIDPRPGFELGTVSVGREIDVLTCSVDLIPE